MRQLKLKPLARRFRRSAKTVCTHEGTEQPFRVCFNDLEREPNHGEYLSLLKLLELTTDEDNHGIMLGAVAKDDRSILHRAINEVARDAKGRLHDYLEGETDVVQQLALDDILTLFAARVQRINCAATNGGIFEHREHTRVARICQHFVNLRVLNAQQRSNGVSIDSTPPTD